MHTLEDLYKKINGANFDKNFTALYGLDSIIKQKERYRKTMEQLSFFYGTSENIRLFSSPGRIEISGNHTDHNNGRVIAAAINLDSIAAARANGENIIRVKSAGLP